MGTTRRVILAVVIVYVGLVAYHGFSSWGWSAQMRTPPGIPAQTVSYTCGAPWGSPYVHGPGHTPYPVEGVPCGPRGSYQVVMAVDVLLGVFVIALVAGWNRFRVRPSAV